VREPWWDDLFVFLAAALNLASVITFLGGTSTLLTCILQDTDKHAAIPYGLGNHIVYILPTFPTLMVWLYASNAAYHTTTVLIKVSLLLQYLRLFRKGLLRHISIFFLVMVSIWGIAFIFLAWFPCIPISAMWNRDASATCYGFGHHKMEVVSATLFTFAGTNMFFDIVIFAIPLSEYLRPGLRKKQILAMTGLFTLGSM
jgi:hypothetical protein